MSIIRSTVELIEFHECITSSDRAIFRNNKWYYYDMVYCHINPYQYLLIQFPERALFIGEKGSDLAQRISLEEVIKLLNISLRKNKIKKIWKTTKKY